LTDGIAVRVGRILVSKVQQIGILCQVLSFHCVLMTGFMYTEVITLFH